MSSGGSFIDNSTVALPGVPTVTTIPEAPEITAKNGEQTYVFPANLISRGHARSVSHGGGIAMSTGLAPGAERRPSALKSANRGHQRALSHGQIVDGSPARHGHNRAGSRTDFILPPGHKEPGSNPSSAISASSVRGHSRQASRSESIYTLRRQEMPPMWRRTLCFVLRRNANKTDADESNVRIVVPNHMVPAKTPRKEHPNGDRPDNKVRTTKYTFLSFIPKNLLEQFHRVANLYFIFIVLLNWFPAINAFGKEVAMIPVVFVLGVTAVKDLFEDRRRRASDNRINNSTCRVYKSEFERYKRLLWRDLKVGDLVHLSNNEVIPADILVLRSSDPHGLCYIDTCNLDGETNLKQRQVARGFIEKQDVFVPSKFTSKVEVDAPTTKIYRFHGAIIHSDGERVPVSTENLLLRECRLKNTDYVEGLVVYAGHETKAMLNNGGPRYKRSKLERQMNMDVIWCVIILIILCSIGAVGSRLWLSSYRNLIIPFLPFDVDPTYEGLLTFWTYIIILQIMIPLSLYVTIELSKILQVYHIHNSVDMYDPLTDKRTECRALNITEELGQVQIIFSDKTGTLTENQMIFRNCVVSGVDYNHTNNETAKSRTGSGSPIVVNNRLVEDLSQIELTPVLERFGNRNPSSHAQRIQEFLLVLALCNTVVVSRTPHRDLMNASGVIEPETSKPKIIIKVTESLPGLDSSLNAYKIVSDKYTRLTESRSVTPSPPPNSTSISNNHNKVVNLRPNELTVSGISNRVPSPVLTNSVETSPTSDKSPQHSISLVEDSPPTRSKGLKLPLFSKSKNHSVANDTSNAISASKSDCDSKPIFEAESPDELALVDAAYSYNCKLINRTPQVATVYVPGIGPLDYEILHVLPFDSTRKCMSIVVRHPVTREIILYCKGADTTILSSLASFSEESDMCVMVERTQNQLNSYARKGLRVLVMAKRHLTPIEYSEWMRRHKECELANENRERRIRDSFVRLETNLILLGATGIEDRLQEGVPETISALISAGIVIWVLTGDKPETAINVAYSAKLFSSQMDILKLMARSKDSAEATIQFYLEEIEKFKHDPMGISIINSQTRDLPVVMSSAASSVSQILPRITNRFKKRALVVDGKTLTFILDKRSNLTKPFLALTKQCSSVLCCRATPLQKAYIVRVVKEELNMRTLAIGDGANDVSMIQTADVGIGISGQEGMQAVMAADFALPRFKYLERFLLVHGHWCYDRLARMILYFFYKNATFVFLIFWFQLYCGFSGSVMIDQMYLMLYNLMFTSLPPIAIGVYDRSVPATVLMSRPHLYRQGRAGRSYRPYSFWVTMADAFYQSIVLFFVAAMAYEDTEVGLWEFGTTITTSCIITMLLHVAIEIKSWTLIHLASLVLSLGAFYAFSLIYNTVCVECFGLPSNYWVIHKTMSSALYWLVIVVSSVLALLPRLVFRVVQASLFPNEATQAMLQMNREKKHNVEDLLVSWSRSTSASSIYRATDVAPTPKQSTMTAVG